MCIFLCMGARSSKLVTLLCGYRPSSFAAFTVQCSFSVLIFGGIKASAMCHLSGVPSVVNLVAFRVYNKWFKSDANLVPFCAFAPLIVAQSLPSAGAV